MLFILVIENWLILHFIKFYYDKNFNLNNEVLFDLYQAIERRIPCRSIRFVIDQQLNRLETARGIFVVRILSNGEEMDISIFFHMWLAGGKININVSLICDETSGSGSVGYDNCSICSIDWVVMMKGIGMIVKMHSYIFGWNSSSCLNWWCVILLFACWMMNWIFLLF